MGAPLRCNLPCTLLCLRTLAHKGEVDATSSTGDSRGWTSTEVSDKWWLSPPQHQGPTRGASLWGIDVGAVLAKQNRAARPSAASDMEHRRADHHEVHDDVDVEAALIDEAVGGGCGGAAPAACALISGHESMSQSGRGDLPPKNTAMSLSSFNVYTADLRRKLCRSIEACAADRVG